MKRKRYTKYKGHIGCRSFKILGINWKWLIFNEKMEIYTLFDMIRIFFRVNSSDQHVNRFLWMAFQTDLLVLKVACPLPQYWTDVPSILCVNQWICNQHYQVISKYWLNTIQSDWLTDWHQANSLKSNFEHFNLNDIHIENIQYVSIHQINSTTHMIYINIRWIYAIEQESEHVAWAYIVCIFIWRITVNSIE